MTTPKHPDPNHAPETHADDAPEADKVKGNKVTTTTTTTIEVADAKPKPAESGSGTTATEEPKKKGLSPWAIAGIAALVLLLLGGVYWFGTHNGATPPTPVATCCPQIAVAGVAPSTCCPQPTPPPPAPSPAKTAQQCANEAVAGMQVASADDSEAAAAAALEACKEAGLK